MAKCMYVSVVLCHKVWVMKRGSLKGEPVSGNSLPFLKSKKRATRFNAPSDWQITNCTHAFISYALQRGLGFTQNWNCWLTSLIIQEKKLFIKNSNSCMHRIEICKAVTLPLHHSSGNLELICYSLGQSAEGPMVVLTMPSYIRTQSDQSPNTSLPY